MSEKKWMMWLVWSGLGWLTYVNAQRILLHTFFCISSLECSEKHLLENIFFAAESRQFQVEILLFLACGVIGNIFWIYFFETTPFSSLTRPLPSRESLGTTNHTMDYLKIAAGRSPASWNSNKTTCFLTALEILSCPLPPRFEHSRGVLKINFLPKIFPLSR